MGGRGSGGGGGGGGGKSGMPSLTGSEKQVAWAHKLRGAYAQFYGKSRPDMVARDVAAHTDASYWINNRHGLGITNAHQRAINQIAYKK